MSKSPKSQFVCRECGYQSVRWLGKCPQCNAWDSLEEQLILKKDVRQNSKEVNSAEIVALYSESAVIEDRLRTGFEELDRVLGGGLTPGSVVMIGGDPGIGKSTLMLQALDKLQDSGKRLYISGEESHRQIQQRARRLNISNPDIFFMNDTGLEKIIAVLERNAPIVAVVDSIQTISSEYLEGVPGNSSQLRFCAAKLIQTAKQNNIALFLIGHVTKDGMIAGPRLLEHLVDTVLYFEGENQADYRLLRAVKNRFGAVNEIAIFQMESNGLQSVANPSELFLNFNERDRQGTAVAAVMGGNRPLLVEVQALVAKTQFGLPQRTVTGIDHRRMNLLLAVLEKRCGKPFAFYDVFLKTSGGLRLDEPSADLAICAALISGLEDREIPPTAVFIGEVSLNGQVRPVSNLPERIMEAEKLGFSEIYIPASPKLKLPPNSKVRMIERVQELAIK